MTQVRHLLERIADALDRLAPAPRLAPDFTGARLFRFRPAPGDFDPAPDYSLGLELLLGVEAQKRLLTENLRRFAAALPANHALLWGSRGVGKSSLVKAAFMAEASGDPLLKLVEIDAEDVRDLPRLFELLRGRSERFVVFCDDLSFTEGAAAAKALKSALEGGVFGAPPNVLFIATSNRRHLAPERHEEGESLVSSREEAEETVSVSDRFGLWIGFPPMDQPAYLAAVAAYAARFDLAGPDLEASALQWARRRGGRSGRVAFQFIRDRAGAAGRPLPF